ncbi:hypothetical protein [Caenibius sp. WL]|uniref:hypothetical protein n=1 Tax=Caenibius sp. WL TaxID=2872646 RepID=UPI001C99703F|nr:hypothetical protein [Caenibius sp. WL]QZP09137.1 hypothetical protein K5X80_05045 [Caenibius sp. WL]
MMTFGRQAKLGGFLITKRDETLKSLTTGRDYLASVGTGGLKPDQATFHFRSYVSGIYSLFEGYLLDLASEMLLCFPDKLRDSEYRLKDFVAEPGDFLESTVEKQTDALGYKRFDVIVEKVMALFQSKPFSSPAVELVQEFKATRDLYVHNRGEWNATYAGKAGPAARRDPGRGKPMPLDRAYTEAGTDAMIAFVTDFHAQGPRQYERFTKARALEGMWTASALSAIMPFSDAWSVESGLDIARPTPRATDWAWSHSERCLYDFFLRIYSDSYPGASNDMHLAIERWPVNSNSGQVILSWLRDPFFF